MLTNRVLSAVEALEWGLITRVTADETLAEEAERLTEQLAVGPAGSHAAVKRLLLVSSRNGLEEQMEIEGRSIAASAISSDGIEGVRAFTEKRRPAFL
jgi:2-(1,2-epoxy-1,2-dihydrophenyl)acetyl-CoA isomerase